MSSNVRFVDSQGWWWQVCQLTSVRHTADVASPDRRRSWLYFLGRHDTRRLSAFPADWAALPWKELERLCRSALPVDADGGFLADRAPTMPAAETRPTL